MASIIDDIKKIDYFAILKKAWDITWENKYLWWFGLFMALGGGFSFNTPFDGDDLKGITGTGQDMQSSALGFVSQYMTLIIIAVIVLIVLVITFMILRIIGQAGIIKAVTRIEKGEASNFKIGFSKGKRYFWKILITGIIISSFIIIVLALLSVPVIYLFYLKNYFIAVPALVCAIVIFAFIILIASFIGKYGVIYIVLGELSIRSAIENGYRLFRSNIYSSILMSLIVTAIGIAAGIGSLVLLIPIALVVVPIGILLHNLLSEMGIIIIVIIGLVITFPVIIFIRSIFETYIQVTWILFFKAIAKINDISEKETEKELFEKGLVEANKL